MNDTIRLGRVAGIPVGVHWSALLVGVAVTAVLGIQILPGIDRDATRLAVWSAAVGGTLLFFASLLAHEFGHAIAARRHGVGVIGLTLWVLGGMAKLARQAPTPRAEFQIAVAGPAANFACGVVFGVATWALNTRDGWEVATGVALWLTGVNLLLAITNLAPGSPLDGGRVLAAWLWKRGGNAEQARLTAGRCGLVLGVLVVIAGLVEQFGFDRSSGWWTIAIGLFVATAAKGDIAGAAVRGRLDSTRLSNLMVHHPTPVPDGASIADFLGWAGTHPVATATPVVRWDHEPLGYVTPSIAHRVGTIERSWTSVARVMLPAELTPRAWTGESVADVLERLDVHLPSVVVVHDERSHRAVGTISDEQILGLLTAPDWWGRDRAEKAPTVPTGHAVGATSR